MNIYGRYRKMLTAHNIASKMGVFGPVRPIVPPKTVAAMFKSPVLTEYSAPTTENGWMFGSGGSGLAGLDTWTQIITDKWARENKDGFGRYPDFSDLYAKAQDISNRVDAIADQPEAANAVSREGSAKRGLLAAFATVGTNWPWDCKPCGFFYGRSTERQKVLDAAVDSAYRFVSETYPNEVGPAVMAAELAIQRRVEQANQQAAAQRLAAEKAAAEAAAKAELARTQAQTQASQQQVEEKKAETAAIAAATQAQTAQLTLMAEFQKKLKEAQSAAQGGFSKYGPYLLLGGVGLTAYLLLRRR